MSELSSSSLDYRASNPYIGAEVRGLDLRESLSKDIARSIYSLWLERSVLLFRDQQLTQADLLRVTDHFGVCVSKLNRPAETIPDSYAKTLPGVMLISNIRENGETVGALPDGEMLFHHDTIHREIPHNATILYSVEVPTFGGDTLFASGYAAYDTLDPPLKKKLEGKQAVNWYTYNTTHRGDANGVNATSQAVHPVFRTHDETGRKAIYVNRLMTMRIEGFADNESDELLNRLFDHSERQEFVYRHIWRPGDLIVWDNRCSSHARTDFPSDQRRLLWRTTVSGSSRPV
jgi:taurine dioxygenase